MPFESTQPAPGDDLDAGPADTQPMNAPQSWCSERGDSSRARRGTGVAHFPPHAMNPRLFLPALLVASLASAQPAAPDAAPAKADSPPAASESPAAAPDHLDTLAQQAPNAVAWVLAPLDAAVPSDIRQNLTYLREALLDEAAKKPAAIPDAYRIGEQLCDTMVSVLDERDRTRAHAGFRAVEAQTRTGISSEALDARRTSSPGKRMNWPRFDREQAQREELKSQAVNKAAVMAERPKLEWSQRSDRIRPTLDAIYKQFREALRKSPGRSAVAVALPVPAPVAPVKTEPSDAKISDLLTQRKWIWHDRNDKGTATLTFHNGGKISSSRLDSWDRWEPIDAKKFKVFHRSGKYWVFEFDAEKNEARTTQESGSTAENRVLTPGKGGFDAQMAMLTQGTWTWEVGRAKSTIKFSRDGTCEHTTFKGTFEFDSADTITVRAPKATQILKFDFAAGSFSGHNPVSKQVMTGRRIE